MQTIKLAQGEEVIINGFRIRSMSGGTSLSIESKNKPDDVKNHLYAGIRGEIVCSGSICVGKVKDLTQGWEDAVKIAQDYIKNNKKSGV